MFLSIPHPNLQYFHQRLQTSLKKLYLSVSLQDLALASIVLFEPIYLYQHGFGIALILAYYIMVYALYFVLMPFGGMMVAGKGAARSIFVSIFFLIGYYLCLLAIPHVRALFWVAPIFFALQKTFFWPAYHADFIMSSDQGERGKEYSGLYALTTVMYILGPFIGGAIIAGFGFTPLFLFVVSLLLISSLPLYIHKVRITPIPFRYQDSIALPFQRQHRRSTIAYLGYGEQLVLLTVWPIYIALQYSNFLSLGGLVSLASFGTAIYTLMLGKMFDRGQSRVTRLVAGFGNALVWLTRPFIHSTGMVFISDSLGRITQNTSWVTISSISYERAVREKNIIARGIMMEQGLALGKVLIAMVILLLMLKMSPFIASFMAAAGFSLLYMVIKRSS